MAAKTLAGAVYDIFNDPSIIEYANNDFIKNGGGKPYHTMVPDSVKPGDHKA